jgi:hypothetical protein
VSERLSDIVTFLFTDIEGSTRLVKQLRDRYGEVLAEHRTLLRTAFTAHAGREIGTEGDSFFVAFPSARNALLAAVEGQLALLSHVWPEGVQVMVRMGIHTGQASGNEDSYTGLAVHQSSARETIPARIHEEVGVLRPDQHHRRAAMSVVRFLVTPRSAGWPGTCPLGRTALSPR